MLQIKLMQNNSVSCCQFNIFSQRFFRFIFRYTLSPVAHNDRPSGLAAGGGFTAAWTRAESGCSARSVGRATPPLAPNRQLCAVIFHCLICQNNKHVLFYTKLFYYFLLPIVLSPNVPIFSTRHNSSLTPHL